MPTDKQSLKEILQSHIVDICFTKKDGTERKMTCTLKATLLPEVELKEDKSIKKDNEEVLAVWDLEKKAFRSFRIESLKSLKYNDADIAYEL